MAVKMVGKIEETRPMNRKLVVWLFGVTGIVSGILWWRGHPESQTKIQLINPVVESRVLPTQTNKPDRLKTEVENRIATQSGTYAIYVYDLKKEVGWGINGDMKMDGASIMKVPAMITALLGIDKGNIKLDQKFGLKEVDRSPGSGSLQYLTAGTEITLERILTEMGKKSDNTGWRMLNRILGIEAIEADMRQIGMINSEYVGYTTTALDVAIMLQKVYKLDKMHLYLRESIYEDRIAKGLPEGVDLVHKVGTLEGVWSDGGIIDNKTILVILNKDTKRAEAEKFVPELTKFIYTFDKKGSSLTVE